MLGQTRQRQSVTARARGARLLMAGALTLLCVLGGTAAAEPPSPNQPPPLGSSDTAPPPGALPSSIPPADVPSGTAEAPPGSVTPGTPLPSASEPVPATSPWLVAPPPAKRHVPFYRKDWFWAGVGVLVITGAILLSVALSSQDPLTPSTRLGDMRAF
jgi:hypothetical protein